MQTGGVINQPLWGSGWSSQLLLWEQQIWEELMQTKQRPAGGHPLGAREHSSIDQQQDSTRVPPIRVTKSTKRFVEEGEHDNALCVNAVHRWNRQYRRWEAIIEFVFQDDAPDGLPIPMHVRLGDNPAAPELPDHSWLFNLLLKLDRTGCMDVAALKGHYFDVTVKTIRKAQHEKADRPADQWYSNQEIDALHRGSFQKASAY